MTVLDTLKALQVEVGSRRAGTDGERRAQEWLKACCQALDLPVEMDEFKFIGSERYRPLFILMVLVLLVTGIGLSVARFALGGALVFCLLLFYLTFVHKMLELRIATARSQNVVAGLHRPFSAYVADPKKNPAFLICAHYDTPRNSPSWFAKLRGALRFLGPLAILGFMLYTGYLALSGIASLFGNVEPIALHQILDLIARVVLWLALVILIPALCLVLFYALYTLLGHKTDSPGADDNGSGTVLVLELARRLKKNPPKNAEVFFAWWGAEELGLFGSRQFVRRYRSDLDTERLYLINIDCVGVGEMLTVHTGQGLFRRKRTDPITVERIERLAAGHGIKTIRSWESPISGGSSDHAEWVERGYRHAISLIRENYRPLSFPARVFAFLMRVPNATQLSLEHIHSTSDTVEVIDPKTFIGTTDLAEAYIREVDQGLAPRLRSRKVASPTSRSKRATRS